MPTVLLIRHGQASFGAADYDVLSDPGRRQAEIVVASLAGAGSGALTDLAAGLASGETAVVVTSGGSIAGVVGNLHSHLETADRALVTYR
jgi:broad specificity phosphatase PhoE